MKFEEYLYIGTENVRVDFESSPKVKILPPVDFCFHERVTCLTSQ